MEESNLNECGPEHLGKYGLETGSINPYIQNEDNLNFAPL
jgi:hypothetical protein